MAWWILPLLTVMAVERPPAPDIHTELVEYKHGDVVLEGFLAWDAALTGRRPAVVIVHEWKGRGANVERRAKEIAKLGYVGFAIDMYGKGVHAKDNAEASRLSGALMSDRTKMRERAGAGLDRLKKVEVVDASRIAAMGYCFGGTTVLELARGGYDVVAVASFHGNLSGSQTESKPIKASVAVFHGDADPHVGPKMVAAFREEMNKAKADWFLVSYGGAVHGFTVKEAGDDPSTGMAYDAKADRRSWETLKAFLAESFR